MANPGTKDGGFLRVPYLDGRDRTTPSLGVNEPLKRRRAIELGLLVLAVECLAELLTFGPRPELGLLLHTFVFFTLVLSAARVKRRYEGALLSVALVPLLRILSYATPAASDPSLSLALVNVPLILGVLLVARELGFDNHRLGLTGSRAATLILIPGVGVLVGLLESHILSISPAFLSSNPLKVMLGAWSLMVFTGLSEELLFRGLLQPEAQKVLGVSVGLVFQAALFAAMHVGWGKPFDLLVAFVVGLVFGAVRRADDSILGVSLAHGIANIVLFMVVPALG